VQCCQSSRLPDALAADEDVVIAGVGMVVAHDDFQVAQRAQVVDAAADPGAVAAAALPLAGVDLVVRDRAGDDRRAYALKFTRNILPSCSEAVSVRAGWYDFQPEAREPQVGSAGKLCGTALPRGND
jgi:hypothetical protein